VRPAALFLALALLGLAATLYLRARPAAPGRGGGLPERLVLDSLKATDARADWPATLLWVERLGRLRPRDPAVLRSRGTAWSNYAVDQRPRRVHARPALRTSLERTAYLRRAVALMDSSTQLAVEPAEWLESGERLAELYENLGLPGDALAAYETVKQRMPDELSTAMHVYWLRARFYDPVHPDTSEYHEQMKRLGQR
jgi:hypothetical protein